MQRQDHEAYTGDRTKEALVAFADALIPSAGQPHVKHADLEAAPKSSGCNMAGEERGEGGGGGEGRRDIDFEGEVIEYWLRHALIRTAVLHVVLCMEFTACRGEARSLIPIYLCRFCKTLTLRSG